MPEDIGQKTETPTPRRRIESRERGQVARSTDLSAACVLLGAMVLLSLLGGRILAGLAGLAGRMFTFGSGDATEPAARQVAVICLGEVLEITLPLMVGLAVVALAANLVQVGFLLTGHPLKPDLNKLNPISGLQRLLSKRSVMKLATDIGKVALIGWVAYATIRDQLDRVVGLAGMDHGQIIQSAAEATFMLGIRLGLILLVLALLDYGYQRWQHEQELKMTKQEVREEMKRMEGDPLMKERRRRVAVQLAMQRMSQDVPKADVVVTNPTEYAVAIRYEPKEMRAPRVVAKGADLLAQRIRQIAQAHGVPILQRKSLAQALYRTVEIGQEIPPSFYKAVAEILAYVYEMSGRARRVRRSMSA